MYLLVVKARMLSLNRRQPMFDGIGKNLSKSATLARLPSTVFKGQLLKANFMLKNVHVPSKLGNGVPWQIQLEGQFAHLEVDEASHRLDLHNVGVRGPDLHQEVVSLAVMLVSRVQITLQLVQKADLELMSDKEIQMGCLVQIVPVALDAADFL